MIRLNFVGRTAPPISQLFHSTKSHTDFQHVAVSLIEPVTSVIRAVGHCAGQLSWQGTTVFLADEYADASSASRSSQCPRT